ncbi:NfeD family protein [Tigheibacillus jepli]|uniref:NfeD family protein n=1 Tax=Tigheibacillus jepli TaxID=3035914 RepID=UPI00387E137C
MKFLTYSLFAVAFVWLFFAPGSTNVHANEEGQGKLVYVIPIENEVERGLEAFLERSINEAMDAGADQLIFEIDTPGRVDAAKQIANLLHDVSVPTTSYIKNDALSAGSYIALNTDNIYMSPQATMGASGVINQDGTEADKKAQSAWLAAMKSAAESKGRDPLYAAAMADKDVDLPEYGAPKGKFLTLGPKQAVEVGYAKDIVKNRTALLHQLGLDKATIVETQPTFAEKLARFLTNPIVVPILLSVASLGLIVELYSPGFGVPGIMGVTALILFFYGHVVAGLAGMEAIILLLIGIALIVSEFFVTSGILGFLGIGAVVGALFMSGASISGMAVSIAIALIVAIIAAIILFKTIGKEKGLLKHIILLDSTKTELGYVASENRLELIGLEGTAVTNLRPSGTALIDGERIDVVTEGAIFQKMLLFQSSKSKGIVL